MSVAQKTETTFKLAEEVFALDVAKVREIPEYTAVTKVPKTADFMRGVINLRGRRCNQLQRSAILASPFPVYSLC